MLIATPAELAARRRQIAQYPVLTRLSARLRTQLEPLLERPLFVPDRKAMLSRDGGVCPDDGARLEFDPFSPQAHRCPRCGRSQTGERHHLAWLMRYHLWLSERAVHCALLGALHDDAGLTAHAHKILAGYAALYRGYPNRDNVLGPTRLFFSTYLESIWLIQVSIAASLSGTDVREMVAESAAIIRSYDEAWSNRQVWNDAAMIAAGRLLDDPTLISRALDGPHGLRAILATAVSHDGHWFEGQNYHFFALRGFQLGAELLRGIGADLGSALSRMYLSPLASLLPDLTIPARSDSPYGVSVRQPRFAELWEVARARTGEERLFSLLAALYGDGPVGGDPGLSEIAEVEQNRPPARVFRDRLGWKALAFMDPSDPSSTTPWSTGSVLSPDHGFAVIRSRKRFISMECGGRPGSHGHPDLLHLSLYWEKPWLVDPGTGSYVSPSLFWYRSTLAHNAPGVAGVGQLARDAWCAAFDERGGWSWCRAAATGVLGPGTAACRTVLVGPDYVLDVVDIDAPGSMEVDLPAHPFGTLVLPAGVDRVPASLPPGAGFGHETGYDCLTHAARLVGDTGLVEARHDAARIFITVAPRPGEALFVAAAPGPPDLHFAESGPLEFLLRRAAGAGRWVQAYATARDAVRAIVLAGDEIQVSRGEGDVDTVRLGDEEARIWSGTRSIRLAGRRPPPPRAPAPGAIEPHVLPLPTGEIPLGAGHYRRSEEPYDPERLRATVDIGIARAGLEITVRVSKPDLVLRRAGDPDPRLDNEPADIHSDGVQCYLGLTGWEGYLLVPDPESASVRIRPVAGTAADAKRVSASWERTYDGYRMRIEISLGRQMLKGDRIPLNVVINAMTPGRQRRYGQLALSGGGWVYQRGDRESPDSAVIGEVR